MTTSVDGAGRRRLILAICCLGIFMVSTDTTILNVALPSVAADFAATIPELQWVLDSYTLVLAGLLLFAGSLADRWGRRRTLQLGLGLFSLASLLCSLSPSVGWLIAFRVLQAVGASMINPVTVSIISVTFVGPAARAKAIGTWGMFTGVALAVGPLLGGVLTAAVGWRSVFWITVPVGVLALVLAGLVIPESRGARVRRFDAVGQVLVILALGLIVGGLIEAPRAGWSLVAPLLVAGGLAAVVVLVLYERRRRDPLLDPRFFGSLPFSAAVASAVLVFTAYGSALFVSTFYLQRVHGLSPPEAGVVLLPMALATTLASLASARLMAARGPRLPFVLAAISLTAGGLCLVGLQTTTSIGVLALGLALIGCGFGAINTPITTTAVASMPRSQAGAAAAVGSSARQVGMAVGVAIAGLVVGHVPVVEFARATHPIWWTVIVASAAVLVLALVATGRRGTESAGRMRPLLDE
ncbi:DHA2 family efflux MFS transporter permease subunit [Herbiconiux sp. UC225_62]|uniref:DHA2 family efflux MFS transporter permease subunit n=1 Tax=Herbiconiux sp. UC225_62 TaxID=3350168 RepID=UPI0036D4253F